MIAAEPVRGGSPPSSPARAARSPAKVVVEVHGDWHTSTRLYGSRARALARPRRRPGRRATRSATPTPTARSRGSRPRCCATEGHEPAAVFATYSDLGAFAGPTVPGPRGAAGDLRRRARALQERRAARGGLAARRRPRSRRRACTSSARGRRPRSPRRLARGGRRLGPAARAAGARRARSTARACSCCPRPPRGSAGSRSRRSCAAGPWSARGSGGIPDIVEDGVSGLLVEPGDAAALAAAIERVLSDHALAVRLGEGAAAERGRLGLHRRRVRRPGSRSRRLGARPVSAAEAAAPADGREDALHAAPARRATSGSSRPSRGRFDLRVLATSADGTARDDGVFHLVGRLPLLDGPLFFLLLPFRVRRLARSAPPAVIVTQSPYEAAFVELARPGAPLVVELHGDWRTATRLYGSPLRRFLAPAADRIGRLGIRHADAVRTISPFTSGARPRRRGRAGRRVRRVRRPRRVRRAAAGTGAGGEAAPLRRRARALQERRGARRRLAAAPPHASRVPSCTWSAAAR